MTGALTAVAVFLLILGGFALFFGRMGKLSFWKLAAQNPEQALEWFRNDPTWVIVSTDQPALGEGFTGPFFIAVPHVGRLKVYARDDSIERSQQLFVERYAALVPRRGFPYLSALVLFYPVAAMLSLSYQPSPLIVTLGYGFANLGYLLAAASILPGHFWILGLDARLPTLGAGVIFWVIGFVLSNVV